MINTFYNGTFASYEQIRIPLTDRSIFFADAVYDVAIGRGRQIYQINEHLNRLFKSAEKVGIDTPNEAELRKSITEISKYDEEECFTLYIQLSRYNERRNHVPDKQSITNVLAFTEKTRICENTETVSLISDTDKRHGICDVKSTNLLCAVLSSEKAKKQGCDECVYIRNGYITECAKSSIFMVKSNQLFTYPLDNCILPSITRKNIIEFSRATGIECFERKFTYTDLLSADEVFICSTTKFLRSITKIDGIDIQSKNPIFARKFHRMLLDDFYSKTSNITTDFM